MHALDNALWHALTGPQRTVAEGPALAKRYLTDVAPFAALPDEPTDEAWQAMGELVGPRSAAVLFRDDIQAPPGWRERMRMAGVQMLATSVEPAPCDEARVLSAADVPDMLALVERTKPGPFLPRTNELGTYLGIRDDGRLVAMAGERMHLDGYTEISAVCTDADHRGRGLATALVRDLVGRIQARAETPILHATADNTTAIRLYEELGFTLRRESIVVAVSPPA